MDNILAALHELLTLKMLASLLAASALGLILGAIPGITVTVSLAMLFGIAMIFPMDQTLSVLLAVYVSGIYGGSLSAILLNIPGAPASAATCLDGYPLACQGRAAYAIGVTRAASVIGTGIGAAVMLLSAPLLAKIAVLFTSAEFFSMALFGLTICSNMTSEDLPVKGWIGGLLGISLALVGIDDLEGVARFTLGIPYLLNGIPFIAVMIGIFAIPEILNHYLFPERPAPVPLKLSGTAKDVLQALRTRIRLILQSAAIGLGIGVIPGVGEDVAAWVSYDAAKKTSREPELFGQGSTEGIIAPEVTSNAGIAGSIIPVLILGIPGSASAAILMATLVLYGLQPGPMLLLEQPLILTKISITLFLADVALFIVAVSLLRPVIFILSLSKDYLMPAITAICLMGAYVANLSYADLIVVLVIGGIGFILKLMHYPPATLALGMILGKMMDVKFRTALVVSDGSFTPFFMRPIAFVFILFSLCMIIRRARPSKKNSEPSN